MDIWLGWILIAVSLFWGVGAYSRLARLRQDVVKSFAELGVLLRQRIQLIQTGFPLSDGELPSSNALPPQDSTMVSSLRSAAKQFSASLDYVQANPFRQDAIAALNSAQSILQASWTRAQDAPPQEGALVPEGVSAQWQQLAQQMTPLHETLQKAIQKHNEAVRLFPAVLLAWVLRFRPLKYLNEL